MNALLGIFRTLLFDLRTRLFGSSTPHLSAATELPLRAELLSAEQMDRHGKTLAAAHRIARGYAADQLLGRLDENQSVLFAASAQLTLALKAGERIMPAGEWLLDNFYLIEEQIRTAIRHLPKDYSRELPRLAEGDSAELPRVYDIALETISHGDGRVDPEGLRRFLSAYQTVSALKLGELWAIPIMLRLALIENLRRVAARISSSGEDMNLAAHWADRMTQTAERDPKSLILIIADMSRSSPPMTTAFVSEFSRRLQGVSPALAPSLTWIEQRLAESGQTIQQLVQTGNQQQAADQVSIGNCIGSLRLLGATDWREFVEAMSVTEHKLREDPAEAYARMDFATRDRYRHSVERIAKASPLSEWEVACLAVQLAQQAAAENSPGSRATHVGHFLIGAGLPAFERAARMRQTALQTLQRAGGRFPLALYLGSIALLTAALTGGFVALAQVQGLGGWPFALIALVAIVSASQLAVSLVNWLATLLATPQRLPRMDFLAGIPAECRTLVVVPTMLGSAQGIEELIEALEVRFLANRDAALHFGLLTDFPDACAETMPDDDDLLSLAAAKVGALNVKYGTGGDSAAGTLFFLFHRPRRWNPNDGLWIGYERKRGKLGDLNALLRGGPRDRFSLIVGDTGALAGVRYVITLDTDTLLPRDAARELVATMAHPLNHPHFDPGSQSVSDGYGILQPRMGASLPGSNQSRYAQLYATESGIDPYTRAVSDVYQDVFDAGSFIGKGIYDVDAFEAALKGRFPANRILSHDLLEGCYVRAGLLSDVQLYEDYPARYEADVSRRRRWIRGDWQIARWLLPRVPHEGDGSLPNPLSSLARWKILDNLRRSLQAPALLFLLLLGWSVTASAFEWTAAALGIVLVPVLIAVLADFLRKPRDTRLRTHLGTVLGSFGRHLAQACFALASLPHEAWYSLVAISLASWRMLISGKKLLDWAPASGASAGGGGGAGGVAALHAHSIWIAPITAVAATAHLAAANPAALTFAAPLLVLWLAFPAIVYWLNLPLKRREPQVSAAQSAFLQRVARKSWAFFETFVGPEDHWLPPDNVQEQPAAIVAHRTSPTNIGLALLANLTAYDFGYIPAGQLLERTANTFDTLHGLDRYRGHFYNWYDTLSLKPLPPHYVSAVDSGNLAGHLLTLRPGLLELADDKIVCARLFEGLLETQQILAEAAGEKAAAELAQLGRELESAIASRPATAEEVNQRLCRATHQAAKISALIEADAGAVAESETRWWSMALARQCQAAADDLAFLAPWVALPAPPAGCARPDIIDAIPTLRELAQSQPARLRPAGEASPAAHAWLAELETHLTEAGRRASGRIARLERLAEQAGELARMEHEFLYDEKRHLSAIGYNVTEGRRDDSYYDLLASEARLTTFVAIAMGQIPQESWFALGRMLTTSGGTQVLMSWSGSMFEYLMPLLVMPSHEGTILDQTYRGVVAQQIAYGQSHGVPWGISESGYNTLDAGLNYQYRAFGVPGLGIKRGLAEDLVVAPYASALALMVAPEEACANLQRLSAEGVEGRYGFYEAVDYTPSRLQPGQSSEIVRSFMAHHQAMIFLSLASLALGRPMQKRFASDRLFQATSLLLQERVPAASAVHAHTAELAAIHATTSGPQMPLRSIASSETVSPEVQLLSNGRYHVMVTNAGGGYSRWKGLAVTRWREDGTRDHWGTFCYLRDMATDGLWSTARQPTLKRAASYTAIFCEAKAEFRRNDQDYETHTEIVVSPEDDIELRRLRITNRARVRRYVEVTTYAEVVLAPAASDNAHPSFSNLFVQTEIVTAQRAILCTRRPRSPDEATPWLFHLMAAHGAQVEEVSYETDRAQFIGRGRTPAAPRAMDGPAALSNSEGSVLDPIVSIRFRLWLDADQSATIDMVTGVGETRQAAISLAEKYHDRKLADRVFDLAWTHSWVSLRQINATEADAQLYGRLAGTVIYANPLLRADAGVLRKNRRGQSGLWSYAISGDLPIVLLHMRDLANIELVRQLVQAHAYWRLKGLAVDLVIWNEDNAGYRQLLQDQIMGLIASGIEAHVLDRPGGIFVRRAEQISDEDRTLLRSAARAIFSDGNGTLAEQVNRRWPVQARVAPLVPTRSHRDGPPLAAPPARNLTHFNGLGGFSGDGREYVITLAAGQATPAPWVNVLANARFGGLVSESGIGYTWSENAHEFRLTPWHNDPVTDASGEAFYLRDEESGYFWSPTPLPCRGATPYVCRHGFGYSVFEHCEGGITSELSVYVDLEEAVKYSVLKVRNDSDRVRRLSVTGYVEWVLGDLQPKNAMHVITEIDPASGALFARNAYNAEFAERIAFFDVDDLPLTPGVTLSADRAEFIGRNGTLRNPAEMRRTCLSGRIGAALDPCGAIQVPFELARGQQREIVFRLGVADARNTEEASKLVRQLRGPISARHALEEVKDYWTSTLGVVQVETPDASLNVAANGWLVYQTLACRLWARSGFYQSGGAFGFRDQLQDVMALIYAEPALTRQHLLLCASRQFREGDVQHWWHPPSGRGVRTLCSDDFLWLPLATSRYVLATGDTGVLDESVAYIEGRSLNPGEESYYDLPERSAQSADLYEHCVQALNRGLRFGTHGLPLIGSGDWNDGMNLVGEHGKGESVWLGFFLYDVLQRFAEIAHLRNDAAFAEVCVLEAAKLKRNLEQYGWDGEWYRRAYFDDGTALGSAANAECQIDSIAQSWSVLSGAGEPTRAREAMNSLERRLVRRDQALIQLLDPPFDKSEINPGYIKGYVPGVRENGGQYTHAAIWAAMAFAALGDRERTWELLSMINPLNHANTPEGMATYKTEPYSVAADVYAVAPHTGRGGWTWYTGSAGWMYRLILESVLGLRREAGKLRFSPCLPAEWPSYKVHYRYRGTLFHITVLQEDAGAGRATVTLDGVEQADGALPLTDDLREHAVEVRIGRAPA